jgi:hypothetical protein
MGDLVSVPFNVAVDAEETAENKKRASACTSILLDPEKPTVTSIWEAGLADRPNMSWCRS